MAKHPCPVRMLMASREEPQIQAAFNGISSQCIHLYLDNRYCPTSDIWIFVNSKFNEVRMTHPLAHTLDARWPSVTDVNYSWVSKVMAHGQIPTGIRASSVLIKCIYLMQN